MPHLKVGGTYLFEHVRKGPFVGVYKGVRPAKQGDPQDEVFFEVDVYTEDGSGSERLANAFVYEEGRKMHPSYSLKYIRPSLLLTVSSPGQQAIKDMTQRYADTIERGRAQAREVGSDVPILPAISIPTAQAMGKLGAESKDATVTARGASLNLRVIAALFAAAGAAATIGYLVLGG